MTPPGEGWGFFISLRGTYEEAAAARKRWRDTQNEGGEGYMPQFRTIDDYEQAKARLAELDKEEMEESK